MAPTNKAQAAGVSSGSFLELRAQVAKQKETLSKGNATAVVGGKKNVGKVRVYINSSFDFCLKAVMAARVHKHDLERVEAAPGRFSEIPAARVGTWLAFS